MQRTPVKSSNIASFGWENGTLEVEFKSGAVYQYHDVPRETFERFANATSFGKHFGDHIKGSFNFKRVK